MEVPPAIVVQPLPTNAKAKPVSLTRIAADIAPGTPWVDFNTTPLMVPCIGSGDVARWTEADNKITAIETFDRIFRQELKVAGFHAGGDPTNLFEDPESSDLQVGALVKELRLKICVHELPIVSNSTEASGLMEIQWQVFSVSRGSVVARITTRGGAVLSGLKDGAGSSALGAAFAENVRRLAADEGFRLIVTGPASQEPAALPAAQISFRPPAAAPIPLSTAVKSVVTIYAGDGAGSGVVISTDGYVLTNHHVAGSSGQVRVHWPDGTDTIGDVVRSDRRRDVALIKTTPKAAPLPIRRGPAQVGETVFAIGTPLSNEFANTLTRGVVSATRLVEGQPMIQSDVAVDHGNSGGPLLDEQGRIVALTVSAYQPDDVSHDINFFIPIDDALRALALVPAA